VEQTKASVLKRISSNQPQPHPTGDAIEYRASFRDQASLLNRSGGSPVATRCEFRHPNDCCRAHRMISILQTSTEDNPESKPDPNKTRHMSFQTAELPSPFEQYGCQDFRKSEKRDCVYLADSEDFCSFYAVGIFPREN